MTYGLPFILPTEKQFVKLNQLLYRPLLTALALPFSVHRAGLAVHSGVPQTEVLREHALLSLVSSILSLSNRPEVTALNARDHPVFAHVWNQCTSANAYAEAVRGMNSDLYQEIEIECPLFVFASLVSTPRWNAHSLLPVSSRACWPNWNPSALHAHLRSSFIRIQRMRMIYESSGGRFQHDGFWTNELGTDHPSGARGTLFASLLTGFDANQLQSIPAADFDLSAIADSLASAELQPITAESSSLFSPSLALDTVEHAKLRTRLILNRSSLNGQRFSRVRRTLTPSERLQKQKCPHCAASPEDALHAIADCPEYASHRATLIGRLHEQLAKIRARASRSLAFNAVANNDRAILLHAVCATPLALGSLTNDEKRRLLRATGRFLITSTRVAPIKAFLRILSF
jgi:hypothetical protein